MRTDDKLAALFAECYSLFTPPENLTVDEWADKYRVLDASVSAEAGQWRTSRTEYMREPMRAFSDPRIEEITVVSPSQVGKSELELNIIDYIIDMVPGSTLYMHPDKKDAKEFSEQRLTPNMKSISRIAEKIGKARTGRKATESVFMKTFPGGFVNLVGTNDANAISSKPIRYIVADELDRWAEAAGRDGDPWELAKKRQETFFNRKRVAVSTPTIKGASRIEDLFYRGTQERWKTQCPHCGEWQEIKFNDIRFNAKALDSETAHKQRKQQFQVEVLGWRCPSCGQLVDELTAKKQPSRWFPDAPENLVRNGARSFWLNGFVSPWCSWRRICALFCEVKDDPEKLKAFKNTTLGELWEMRVSNADEREMMARAEEYPSDADLPGTPGMSNAPLVLTCGVDCQHNYLQYEIVGWGRFGESWGIRAGYIPGSPRDMPTWHQLDSIISRAYRYSNGQGLRVAMTFVDSGDGNYTSDIAAQCAARRNMGVFAIKGDGRDRLPLVNPPKKIPIGSDKTRCYWLYTIGVNEGKGIIMDSVAVQQPGSNYMHLPRGDERGYDLNWYMGLLSETEVRKGNRVVWEKLAGHNRNEALDCRNYALAAARVLAPDYDAIARALANPGQSKKRQQHKEKPAPRRNKLRDMLT